LSVAVERCGVTTAPTDESAEGVGPITEPERVAKREGVAWTTSEYDHDSPEHCENGVAGRAVVCVVRADGAVLVRSNESEPTVLPPTGTVEAGDDWAAVARETTLATTGVAVTLDRVLAVRHVDHVVEGTTHQTTHHIVFRGTPTGGVDADPTDGGDWTTAWIDQLPAPLEGVTADPFDDLRLVL
jgi:hypothetical protein